jgi:hypothetical protein
MKIVRWLFILALAAGYFIWPYHATRKFAEAVQAKDTATIEGMVDFDELRASLLNVAMEAAFAQAEQRMQGLSQAQKDAMREKLRSMMESGPMKKQIDQHLKPETLARMLASGPSQQRNGNGFRNEKWVSPIEFSVQDRDSEARAIFKFRGLGWKLCALEVPKSEMHRLMAMSAAR